MKLQLFNLVLLFTLHNQTSSAQAEDFYLKKNELIQESNHINFFIISKREKGKIDPATSYNVLRAKFRSILNNKHFKTIVAVNARQMSVKVKNMLLKNKAKIGTIWFDSHGKYKKGYSLFTVGSDEVSVKTLADSSLRNIFGELAGFADEETKIVIGACYGGATYERMSVDYKNTTRMNGDSLMITLGSIFQNGIIYGSESWVMTKPGIFSKKASTGGYPARKLFLDLCYEPAWRKVGQWNQFKVREDKFEKINTVSLDASGNLVIRGTPYLIEKKKTDEIVVMLSKLEPNLYK